MSLIVAQERGLPREELEPLRSGSFGGWVRLYFGAGPAGSACHSWFVGGVLPNP